MCRSERVRARLTGVVILGYTGLFAVTTWQAMRGQSLIHPDAATWTALAVTAARRGGAAPTGGWRPPGPAPSREPVGSRGRDHTAV